MKARKLLSSRITDVRIRFIPGLADDLRAIDGAFADIESGLATLAAVMLRKHYWPDAALPQSQFEALATMGQESAAIQRVAMPSHPPGCLCNLCFPAFGKGG